MYASSLYMANSILSTNKMLFTIVYKVLDITLKGILPLTENKSVTVEYDNYNIIFTWTEIIILNTKTNVSIQTYIETYSSKQKDMLLELMHKILGG